MKILVIGLGSMGKRRINLLKSHFGSKHQVIGVDNREDRRNEAEHKFCIEAYKDLDEAINIEQPEAALICTSPISHGDLIVKCLDRNIHVFTEINLLSSKYDEIIETAREKGLKLFLSSTMLYRKEIQYIQQIVSSSNKIFHYQYHVGQYLPDWHPWENFKDFFVGNKKTNGCRELFAIELPWLTKTFGKVIGTHVVKNNMSSLELEYPDSYIVIFEHENGHKGTISVDVVSRKATRRIEIYSESNYILWEGTPATLMEMDLEKKQMNNVDTYTSYTSDRRYAENIIEDAYLDELQTFVELVEQGDAKVRYTFEEDLYTLSLIDQIEGEQC